MPKIIIFAGAPKADSLNWDTPLHDSFIPPISDFVGLEDASSASEQLSDSQPQYPQWRSLPLAKHQLLQTGLTQQPDYFLRPTHFNPSDNFFTSIPTGGYTEASEVEEEGEEEEEEEEEEVRSQFYEHSLALHETSHPDEASLTTDTSTSSGQFQSFQYSPAPSLDPIGTSCRLTNLSSIPHPGKLPNPKSAPTIISIMVGILSLTSHTATTRFGPRPIIELLVGDETRSSGFQVTFWLPPPTNPGQSLLGKSLAGLRRGDVILVHGMQLGVFRDRVFGQSVRAGEQGYGTRVHLMYRGQDPFSANLEEGKDEEERRGHYTLKDLAVKGAVHPQLEKTKRVRMWVLEYLGVRETLRKGWDVPPQDTQ
jgi:hypothetical protein